ncbi:xanthine phosphoribosyltransferase [Alicyclobacillus contaminans]|uniref:xanthine phosphoribosyltransferase n=1 Tax=Alicyclobacillus contaminans TaxID=392016 RepID=UPI000550C9E1|nr:xanthine phosphoribosyltransferase [Alicyclobacillus contaminans]GMA51712.1 xanthine phosphoribosyltransferase [Alicyclobacillus contaminans]
MNRLQERIVQDGVVLSPTVLKVDAFLNHQVDPELVMDIGAAMAAPHRDAGVTKVLTVEASGIPLAMATALALGGIPFVYAKKKRAITQGDAVWTAPAYSFTRQESYHVSLSKAYLGSEDVVLMVDDILAEGSALTALTEIVHQAGARVVGAVVAVEKRFQSGREKLAQMGVQVRALAGIESMSANGITFAQDDESRTPEVMLP